MTYYAVIDTNVLVSAMLKADSIPRQILNAVFNNELIPLLCNEIIDEYREVLARPKFKFDQKAVRTVVDGLIECCEFLEPEHTDEKIPDPKDVVFYEVALEGRKKFNDAYLITGNTKHFPIKHFVVTPREMQTIIYGK